jgi:hypothetical protein
MFPLAKISDETGETRLNSRRFRDTRDALSLTSVGAAGLSQINAEIACLTLSHSRFGAALTLVQANREEMQ